MSSGARFTYFFDRTAVEKEVSRKGKRWLGRVGALVRKIARSRSILRRAPQKPLRELTPQEKARYRQRQGMFKAGKITAKPRRPERSARKGEPPLLHVPPAVNPLRKLLFYSYDPRAESVVIGPENFGERAAKRIEQHNPFMRPALGLAQPKIAEIVRK